MKKIFTKLLFISFLCAVITLLLCFFAIKYNRIESFPLTKKVINEVNNMGDNTPGAGEYLLLAGGVSLLSDLSISFFYIIIALVIPAFLLLFSSSSQIISRLFQVGSEQNWKNVTSKIFTIISIVTELLLCICFIAIMFSGFLNKYTFLFILLALTINIVFVYYSIKSISFIKIESKNKKRIKGETNDR